MDKSTKDDQNFAEASRVSFDDIYRLILSGNTEEMGRILTSGEQIDLNTIHTKNVHCLEQNEVPTLRMPVLHLACMYKRLEMVRLLLEHGADPLYRDDRDHRTAAWVLLMYWMVPDLLINRLSTDDEEVDEVRRTFILNRRRHLSNITRLLDLLLQHSKDPQQPSIVKGRTLLHLCALRNLVNPIVHLLNFGAFIDQRDHDGYTPAMSAAFHGNLESLMELLRLGANIQEQDNAGRNILHIVAGSERINASQMAILLKECPDLTKLLNEQTLNGETPLHQCAIRGNGEKIHLLLSKGADCSAVDSEGQTPIYLLLKLHSIACVYLGFISLLTETQQLSLKDAEGNYPIKLMEDCPRHVRQRLLSLSCNPPRLYSMCLQRMNNLLARPQDVATASNMYRDSRMVSIADALQLDCPREIIMDILTYKHSLRNKWSHFMFSHI